MSKGSEILIVEDHSTQMGRLQDILETIERNANLQIQTVGASAQNTLKVRYVSGKSLTAFPYPDRLSPSQMR